MLVHMPVTGAAGGGGGVHIVPVYNTVRSSSSHIFFYTGKRKFFITFQILKGKSFNP